MEQSNEEVKVSRSTRPSELIYGLEDRPPLAEALFVAIQHVLAAFVGIVTPPLILSGALGLDPETTTYIISMSLLASGIGTFIQCRTIGPIGSGLLSLQGTSFSFLAPIVAIATTEIQNGRTPEEALALIFGVCFFGSFVVIILSRFLHLGQKIITPVVSGTVVLLIGLSLIRTGINSFAGGSIARADGTFGSYENLALGGLVFSIIIFLTLSKNRYLRMGAIAIGLLVGYTISLILGRVDFAPLQTLPWIAIPIPFRYGMRFDFAALVPFVLLYILIAVEDIGDLTATSAIARQPIEGKAYIRRMKGGVLGDGVNSMLASVLNTFPVTTFSQNNGVIQMTGVGSRYVGYYIGGVLAALGLLPIVAGLFQSLPQPVLGGAATIVFGSIAVAGINILGSSPLDRRSIVIVAVSLALGLGVTYTPELLADKPQIIQTIFSSSVATGGLMAIVLNTFLPQTLGDGTTEADSA
jgi:xanthine permease XanP